MTSPTDDKTLPARLAQLSRAFTDIPFNKMLGLQLDHVDADQVSMNFIMKEELVGNFLYGILHGGVISSVLDMAGGMAAMAAAICHHSDLATEELVAIIGKCSTVDLQISYLRPGRGNVFTAKAWLIKRGKKISFARMELVNQDGLLIATGSATYLLK
jgi:uncharacterized protein (TIGR00369 family)